MNTPQVHPCEASGAMGGSSSSCLRRRLNEEDVSEPGKILLGRFQGEKHTLVIERQTMANILSAHTDETVVSLLYWGFSLCFHTSEDKKADTRVKTEAKERPLL